MELKYQELLIIAYFKSHYKKYEFNEILRIMGMTYMELNSSIERLIKMNYLACYGDYLIVTKKGENFLKDMRLENFFIGRKRGVKRKKQGNIEEPYIPINFKI